MAGFQLWSCSAQQSYSTVGRCKDSCRGLRRGSQYSNIVRTWTVWDKLIGPSIYQPVMNITNYSNYYSTHCSNSAWLESKYTGQLSTSTASYTLHNLHKYYNMMQYSSCLGWSPAELIRNPGLIQDIWCEILCHHKQNSERFTSLFVYLAKITACLLSDSFMYMQCITNNYLKPNYVQYT